MKIRINANTGIIEIEGPIYGFSRQEFKARLDELKGKNIRNIKIYINSEGGSVFDAYEIANQILKFEGSIEFELGALCASAATIIIAEVYTRRGQVPIRMHRNGQMMIHNVQATIEGDIKEIESSLQLLQNIEKTVIEAYSKMTGLSEEQLREMMDKTTWLSAQQALELGFITEIIDKVSNETKIKVKNQSKMSDFKQNVVAMLLGLGDNASQVDIENKVKQLVDENQQLKTELEQVRNELEKQKMQELEALLNDKNLQITAEQRDAIRNLAKKDYENAFKLVKQMPRVKNLREVPDNELEKYKDWDWDKLHKEKPAVLQRIKNERPDIYEKIFEDKFGHKPKN